MEMEDSAGAIIGEPESGFAQEQRNRITIRSFVSLGFLLLAFRAPISYSHAMPSPPSPFSLSSQAALL